MIGINITDIEKFTLNIPNTTIYSDDPKISNNEFSIFLVGYLLPLFLLPAIDNDNFPKRINSEDL